MSEADNDVPHPAPELEKPREKTTANEQPLQRGLPSWLYQNPAPALTIAGVLIYAFLRFNYALFYSKMGLTPEDVGMTYVTTLVQTIGLVAYIFYFIIVGAVRILFFVLLVMLFMPIGASFAMMKSKRPQLARVAYGIFVVIPLLYGMVSFLYPPLPSRPRYLLHEEEDAILLIAVVAPSLAMLIGSRIKMPPELQARNLKGTDQLKEVAQHVWDKVIGASKSWWPYFVPFGVYIAVFLLLMGAIAVPLAVAKYADKAKAGQSVRGVLPPAPVADLVADLPVLSLHAERARVSSKTIKRGARSEVEESVLAQHTCLMYLGESGGTTIFYDAQNKQTIRAPSNDIVVTLTLADSKCPPPTTTASSPAAGGA